MRGHLYALGVREARQNLAPSPGSLHRRLVVDLLDAQQPARYLLALAAHTKTRSAIILHDNTLTRDPSFDRDTGHLDTRDSPSAMQSVTGLPFPFAGSRGSRTSRTFFRHTNLRLFALVRFALTESYGQITLSFRCRGFISHPHQ